MRVKAFSQETAEDLEQEVGAWLAAHPAITIVTAVQSMGRSFAGDRIVLTLFYTEAVQAEHAPQHSRSELDPGEPVQAQRLSQPPRPVMAPPSSGAGRASPLSPPPGSALSTTHPSASDLAPVPPAPGAAQQ